MAESDLSKFANDTKNCLVGLIGNGNMSYAIAAGLIKKGLPSSKLIVSGLDQQSFNANWKKLGVQETLKNIDVLNQSTLIILCVKPNNLGDVSADIEKDFQLDFTDKFNYSKKILISILAGVQLSNLKDSFSFLGGSITILRAMPNTPLQVGCGCTAITPYSGPQKDMISSIFKALGEVEFLDESKFDAITGLSGSGPAYIYMIIDALTDAGINEGLPCDLARKFAAQTVLGSAKTVLDTGKHPGQLKNEVCSPGGTTIRGVFELEKGGLRATLMNAVKEATNRSKELSKV